MYKCVTAKSTLKLATSKSGQQQKRMLRVYGNLKDQDRIFTNLYREQSPFLEDALKRVSYFGTNLHPKFILID